MEAEVIAAGSVPELLCGQIVGAHSGVISDTLRAYIRGRRTPSRTWWGIAPAFTIKPQEKTLITRPGVPRKMENLLVHRVDGHQSANSGRDGILSLDLVRRGLPAPGAT